MFSAVTFGLILCCTTYIAISKLMTKIRNNKVSVTGQNLIQASQIGISLVELQGTSENAQKHVEECDTESSANEVSNRQATYQANPNIGPDGKNKCFGTQWHFCNGLNWYPNVDSILWASVS